MIGIHNRAIRSLLSFFVLIGTFTAFLFSLDRVLNYGQTSLNNYLFIVQMSLGLFWALILLIEQMKGGYFQNDTKTCKEKTRSGRDKRRGDKTTTSKNRNTRGRGKPNSGRNKRFTQRTS